MRSASFTMRAALDLRTVMEGRFPPVHYVCILYSPSINGFYIGGTSNIRQRIEYHNIGLSPYTKNKGPWQLVHSEKYETKREALMQERKLKSWKSSKRLVAALGIAIAGINSEGILSHGMSCGSEA